MNTPETDAAEKMAFAQEYMVPTDFARQLEQERNSIIKKSAELEIKCLKIGEVITELNQRLQERQESFQAQLIRIEEVWREKLREARQDADQLAGAIEIAIPHLPYSAGSAKARHFAVKHGNTSDEFAFKALLTSFERHEALTAKR